MAVKRLILEYPPDVVEEPIIYLLVKEYDLKVNILKARIRPRQGGRMIIELSGDKAALEAGMNYLTGLGIRTQPLVRQIQLDKDKCVDCTACLPHCPTGALHLEEDKSVALNVDRCVVCETCVTICPYRAIEILF